MNLLLELHYYCSSYCNDGAKGLLVDLFNSLCQTGKGYTLGCAVLLVCMSVCVKHIVGLYVSLN